MSPAHLEEYLLGPCRVRRTQVTGDYRRRVEVIEEISFVIETDDFTRNPGGNAINDANLTLPQGLRIDNDGAPM